MKFRELNLAVFERPDSLLTLVDQGVFYQFRSFSRYKPVVTI